VVHYAVVNCNDYPVVLYLSYVCYCVFQNAYQQLGLGQQADAQAVCTVSLLVDFVSHGVPG